MTDNRATIWWRFVQALSLALGIGELVLLFAAPSVGVHLLWNVLIPLAPLVFMLAPGVWRNVCPLSVVSQLPRRFRIQSARQLSYRWQVAAIAIGWAALLLIVPMRHLWFDRSGPLTAVILIILGSSALLLGSLFDGKSGWCSTCCPVHIVEKLYGHRTALPVRNAHCDTCTQCVAVCPDRQTGPDRLIRPKGSLDAREAIGHTMVGGFAGYVFGWFQCPDFVSLTTATIIAAYAWPLGGMTASLAAYVLFVKFLRLPPIQLSKVFAAAAIAIYYWFRIPMLFGFGRFGNDGCLVNLTGQVPTAIIGAVQVAVLFLIFAWLVRGLVPARPWMTQVRPASALS